MPGGCAREYNHCAVVKVRLHVAWSSPHTGSAAAVQPLDQKATCPKGFCASVASSVTHVAEYTPGNMFRAASFVKLGSIVRSISKRVALRQVPSAQILPRTKGCRRATLHASRESYIQISSGQAIVVVVNRVSRRSITNVKNIILLTTL